MPIHSSEIWEFLKMVDPPFGWNLKEAQKETRYPIQGKHPYGSDSFLGNLPFRLVLKANGEPKSILRGGLLKKDTHTHTHKKKNMASISRFHSISVFPGSLGRFAHRVADHHPLLRPPYRALAGLGPGVK